MDEPEYIIFLDDERDPLHTAHQPARQIVDTLISEMPQAKLMWAKNSTEFKYIIDLYGIPAAVSFDHDINEIDGESEVTGLSCARLVCNLCLDTHAQLPRTFVHTSNPAGRDNIIGEIKFYVKHHSWMSPAVVGNCPGEIQFSGTYNDAIKRHQANCKHDRGYVTGGEATVCVACGKPFY
jgi:hypothetical protein